MATIAVNKKTGARYVVIGAGLGLWATHGENPLEDAFVDDGDVDPVIRDERRGGGSLLALVNADGEVGWTSSSQVRIESINGRSPKAILERTGPYR